MSEASTVDITVTVRDDGEVGADLTPVLPGPSGIIGIIVESPDQPEGAWVALVTHRNHEEIVELGRTTKLGRSTFPDKYPLPAGHTLRIVGGGLLPGSDVRLRVAIAGVPRPAE